MRIPEEVLGVLVPFRADREVPLDTRPPGEAFEAKAAFALHSMDFYLICLSG